MIDEIEIYQGSRYRDTLAGSRIVNEISWIASSNLDDIQPEFIAKALIVEGKDGPLPLCRTLTS